MKLTIYAIESSPVVATKAIREALRKIFPGAPVPVTDAYVVLVGFNEEGEAVLADLPDDTEGVAALLAALGENGVFATVGDPQRARRQYDAQKLSEAGATPEDVFNALAPGEAPEAASDEESDLTHSAATAMTLLVMTEGNPLNACAHAFTLARATGDPEFWTEVQRNLVSTFPFLEKLLRDNGVLLG